MEMCPKCGSLVLYDELLKYTSLYKSGVHICIRCAILEGQPSKVEPYRQEYKGKVYFHRKKKR